MAIGNPPAVERKVTVRGLPVYAGSLLTADSPAFQKLRTQSDFTSFAQQLRGQFCIVVADGSRSMAITDFGCSRPVYYLRDPQTQEYRVSTRMADLIPFSRKQISKEALFFYAARGGVWISPFYPDIKQVHAATIASFAGGGMGTSTYLAWEDFLVTRPTTAREAEDRFIEIASGYLGALVKGHAQVGCLVSGGTDSAVVAWLLRQLGAETTCFTGDYDWKRYSEYSSAQETTTALGLGHRRVAVGMRARRDSFYALNGPKQSGPCCDGQAPTMHRIASEAAEQGISLLVTGDHADSVFLGFDRFFRGFPQETQAYCEAAQGLDVSGKLSRLYGPPNLTQGSRRLLAAFGGEQGEFLEWESGIYQNDRLQMFGWAHGTPLHLLQQLGGQLWAGISWQNLFLSVMQALDDRIDFVSPFYDLEMIRFAMSLPIEFKFRDGTTKPLLRDILKRVMGRSLEKRASPNPARFWRLVPDFHERRLQGDLLRSSYDRAYMSNVLHRGALWGDVDKVGALGIWLSGQPLERPLATAQ